MAKSTITPEPSSAQEKSSRTRHLKVRKGQYEYQAHRRSHKEFEPYVAPAPVPWVEIKGYWLDKVGFSVGTDIHVSVRKGCLVLKAVPSAAKN